MSASSAPTKTRMPRMPLTQLQMKTIWSRVTVGDDMFDPIWEVRHGTIMALREILTHQGACAGVYFPDLSSPLADLDDKTDSDSMKRPQGIDLNEDIDVEQLEPVLKRHKKDEPNSSEIVHEPVVERHTEEEKSNSFEIMDLDL